MDKLIYTAGSGAKHILEKQATASNNLANVNTTGFRAQIDAFRAVTAHGRAPNWELLALSTAMSVIILVVAYVYFKRAERDFADII